MYAKTLSYVFFAIVFPFIHIRIQSKKLYVISTIDDVQMLWMLDIVFYFPPSIFPVGSDDALFLLATCYYRSGKPIKAYTLLKNKGANSTQCRYLQAQCCSEINKYVTIRKLMSSLGIVLLKNTPILEIEY